MCVCVCVCGERGGHPNVPWRAVVQPCTLVSYIETALPCSVELHSVESQL